MSEILVHNNWDPLEEIWLGDVWPEHFYDDLEPEIRDSFYKITEWTKTDLNIIQKKLEEFNVVVRRPFIDPNNKQLYCDKNTNKLLKPPITPRDMSGVVNDKLYFADTSVESCYQPLLDLYPEENVFKNVLLSGAGTVKLGKDIIIDTDPHLPFNSKEHLFKLFHGTFNKLILKDHLLNDYRIHYATGGGHMDGCFMPLKPGLILTTRYWNNYKDMFPEWRRIDLNHPTYKNHTSRNGNGHNGKWFLPGSHDSQDRLLNQYVEEYCKNWIGNYTETYFEVNVVMIDEKNMLCMGAHESLFNDLEKEGITCHVVPFRTRGFWDGGIHCITLDIRRRAVMKDYFPERGSMGLKSITSDIFKEGIDADEFLKQYESWKTSKGLE